MTFGLSSARFTPSPWWTATLLALACAWPASARGEDPAPSLELRVNHAIGRGLKWLVGKQAKDGTWPGHENDQPGGMTALACLALVKSGVARDDPALYAGLRALQSVEWKKVYACAVYLMLIEALDDKQRTRVGPKECLDFLVKTQRDGMWGYPDGYLDMSNTQFALLGLRSAKHLGLVIPDETVERCAGRIADWQEKSGGFVYWLGRVETGGMTAASLAGFAVLSELGQGRVQVETSLRKRKDDVRRAEIYMEERFRSARNPCAPDGWLDHHVFSYLWAVERWCGLTDRKKIGEHDWYREGAEWLIAHQAADGSFSPWVEDACFALLFLRRATVTSYQDLSSIWKALDTEKAAAEKAKEKDKLAPEASVARTTDWLLAGPFPDKHALDLVRDPTWIKIDKLHPRERERVGERALTRVTLESAKWTDLEVASGRQGPSCAWVLAQDLGYEPEAKSSAAGAAPLAAILWLDVVGPWKVFLDGRLVAGDMEFEHDVAVPIQVGIELTPGHHALVVLTGVLDWQAALFGARLTDLDGEKLPIVRASAEPPPRRK